MSTKRLTLEEKVTIVQEAEQFGFTEVALKHNISSRQIYRWRDKLEKGGSKALSYGAKIRKRTYDSRNWSPIKRWI
jgi:transposase-like protein